jgi:hypothetical protein
MRDNSWPVYMHLEGWDLTVTIGARSRGAAEDLFNSLRLTTNVVKVVVEDDNGDEWGRWERKTGAHQVKIGLNRWAED